MGYISYQKAFELMEEKGLSTYKIRQKNIISESTLQNMRHGKPIRTDAVGALCDELECQPGDLIEYIRETKQE